MHQCLECVVCNQVIRKMTDRMCLKDIVAQDYKHLEREDKIEKRVIVVDPDETGAPIENLTEWMEE